MFFGRLLGRVTVAGNFRRALWSKDAGGNGGGGARAAPGRRRARLRVPGRGIPASCLQHRVPHAGQPRRGRRSRAGGVSPRSPGDRRVSGGVQALHLALRDHLAPVPQPARLRRAADGAGPGGGGDADRSAERRWRRGGPDGPERDGGRAPPGDRRAARRAPHRGRPARSGGPVLRGDRRHARADARHRALAPAPGAPGALTLWSRLLSGEIVTAGRGEFFRADALSTLLALCVSVVGALAAWLGPGLGADDGYDAGQARRFRVFANLFAFTMLLAVTTNNVGFMWVAIEATTITSAVLIPLHVNKASVEASWKYILIASVGIALAFAGTVLAYFDFVNVAGRH